MVHLIVPDPNQLRGALGDRYRFERELGVGGMATVSLAHDLKHDRKVAVKVLRPELATAIGPDRFLSEIRLTANLNHPNILPLFDSGEVGSSLYYVMPYVAGESLRARLDRDGQFGLEEARVVAEAIAAGLDYAHAQGVVHRDIKPENILLQGEATFIADFGVALALADDRTTSPGLSMGTPAYMSPEQISGDMDLDGRSDVYSLGCVVYEMLTGSPPFTGDSRTVMMHHLTEEPRLVSGHRQDQDARLDETVARALAKSPEDRFPRASDFTKLLTPDSTEKRPPPPTTRTSGPWKLDQEIRFCRASDGGSIAYAVSGSGPPMLKTANWLSHLEFDADSPLWGHWWNGLSERFRLIRYDDRGCGLSDWDVPEIGFEAWVSDLEAVADAAELERFALLGVSKGGATAVAYAVRHPERVSHLILHGAYSQGKGRRRNPAVEEEARLESEMIRVGWGKKNPAFRQVFTTLFFPGAVSEQMDWFNELMRVSASPENAVRILEASREIDVTELAQKVRCPTLILHSRDESRVPFEQGRRLASLIPGARFVPLPGRNHLPLAHEAAWQDLMREVIKFTGVND